MEQLKISPYLFPLLEFKPESTDEIIERVAASMDVCSSYITSRSRIRPIVEARSVAMYLLRKTGMSYTRIGRCFKRDHATVIWAIKNVENWLQVDKDFRERTKELI